MAFQPENTEPSTHTTLDSKPESTQSTTSSSEKPKESEPYQYEVAAVFHVIGDTAEEAAKEASKAMEALAMAEKYHCNTYPNTRFSLNAVHTEFSSTDPVKMFMEFLRLGQLDKIQLNTISEIIEDVRNNASS